MGMGMHRHQYGRMSVGTCVDIGTLANSLVRRVFLSIVDGMLTVSCVCHHVLLTGADWLQGPYVYAL